MTVGSNSNVAENGMEQEVDRAAILGDRCEDGRAQRSSPRACAIPTGSAWEPATGALWTVVNERDELGSDLVPDYLTSVQDGGFYGWPYSYYGQTRRRARASRRVPTSSRRRSSPTTRSARTRRRSASPSRRMHDCRNASAPACSSASTARGTASRARGYKVIFVPFSDGKPSGMPIDVLTGFVDGDGQAHGRPVGVAVDKRGALLVADDVGNVIWRVSAGSGG